jgi:hypothetical protein
VREANAGVGGMKGRPSRGSATITTTSLAETLTMARFMVGDRDADAFARPSTEAVFQAGVCEHFWSERQGSGGWKCATAFCYLQCNVIYTKKFLGDPCAMKIGARTDIAASKLSCGNCQRDGDGDRGLDVWSSAPSALFSEHVGSQGRSRKRCL